MSVGLVMAWDQRGGLLAGAGKFMSQNIQMAIIQFINFSPGQQETCEMLDYGTAPLRLSLPTCLLLLRALLHVSTWGWFKFLKSSNLSLILGKKTYSVLF